jgi:hypothetical protein
MKEAVDNLGNIYIYIYLLLDQNASFHYLTKNSLLERGLNSLPASLIL